MKAEIVCCSFYFYFALQPEVSRASPSDGGVASFVTVPHLLSVLPPPPPENVL